MIKSYKSNLLAQGVSPELASRIPEVIDECKKHGLDPFELVIEEYNADEIAELGAYGGFPVRYPHFSFGQQYETLHHQYHSGMGNSVILGGAESTDSLTEGSSNLYFTNERVDDRVNSLLTEGSNITLTYNDAGNALTIAATNTDTQLSTEQVEDIVGAMVSSNTETNITVTYDDTNGKLNFSSTDTNTQLTQAQVRDFAGGMFTGNTETFITATYQTSDDTIDLVVPVLDEDDMNTNSATHLATQQSIKAYVDAQVTAQDLDFQGDSGGALSIDLDSETLDIAGGTGVTTAGSGNTVTVNICKDAVP